MVDPKRPESRRLFTYVSLVALLMAVASASAFVYADGPAYFTDDPQVCGNCHIMQRHVDAWGQSIHAGRATCNDCHLSTHPIGHWLVKTDNAVLHVAALITGTMSDPLVVKPRNARVTHARCVGCHAGTAHDMPPDARVNQTAECTICHAHVGHDLRAYAP